MLAFPTLRPPRAPEADSTDPGGSRLLKALDRIHQRLGQSPANLVAYIACVDAWLAEFVAAATEHRVAEASVQLLPLIAEALEALNTDHSTWQALLRKQGGEAIAQPFHKETLAAPLHPRLVCGCFFVLKSLLFCHGVSGASSFIRAAVSAAVENIRLLPAARFLCEGRRGSSCRPRVKHLGRPRRKGMEQQEVEAAKQQQQQEWQSGAASDSSVPPCVAAAYLDAEEIAALHGSAVSLAMHLLMGHAGVVNPTRPGGEVVSVCCELLSQLRGAMRQEQGDAGHSEEASASQEPPVRGTTPPTTVEWKVSFEDLPFSSLAALAATLCSTENEDIQQPIAEFATRLLPVLLDLLTVDKLQPLAATARTQLLPAVLRRVPRDCASAFLFAAMHRLLSPLIPSTSGSVADDSPCSSRSSTDSLSLQVFCMLQQGPPPPRCAEAFDLATRHHDVFLSEDDPPPACLERAEKLLEVRRAGFAEAQQQQANESGKQEHEGSNHAWGPHDVRWRWLFWGLSCPVIGCVRSSARQLLQLLQQRQKQQQQKDGVVVAEQQKAWTFLLQLLEALDDFSQHLIKQQLETLRKLCALVATAAARQQSRAAALWPLQMQPLWIEALLLRAFAHDNALLSRTFLLAFMDLCIEGSTNGHRQKQYSSLLLCVSSSFVLEAMVPHMGVPSFFCRSNDCRQAEATVQRFLQQKLALEAAQQEPSPQNADSRREACVARYLKAVGGHCHTYTPLRVFLDALLIPGEHVTALQQQAQQPQRQQLEQREQLLFLEALAQLMKVISTTPHSVRGSLHGRILRVAALHAPAGCLSLPVLGVLVAALPHSVFAVQLREAAAATSDNDRCMCTKSSNEGSEALRTPALLQLLHAAFSSRNDLVEAVQQRLQHWAREVSNSDEAEKQIQQHHNEEQHAALVLVRLLAAAAIESPHELSQALPECVFSEDISKAKQVALVAAAAADRLVLSLTSPHQEAAAAALAQEICATLRRQIAGLARGLLAFQQSGETAVVHHWPDAAVSFELLSVDLQQRLLALRHLLKYAPSVNFMEALATVKDLTAEEAFGAHGDGGKDQGNAFAALLKTAFVALAQWGLVVETQTTRATAIIGALAGGAAAYGSTLSAGSMEGIWFCANLVLGSSINRKTLSALKHASLRQTTALQYSQPSFDKALLSTFGPEIFSMPEGIRQWQSWLDVVEWFYSSKGDALGSLLDCVPLITAAKQGANFMAAAEQPLLLPLLPRCTPSAAVSGYSARISRLHKTCGGLFIVPASQAEGASGEPAPQGPEAVEGPLGVALLLLQEVGESHLCETPSLLGAVASFALPVLFERLVQGTQRDSGASRSLAAAMASVFSAFVADCKRLIQERLETSISPSLIGRLCCVVLHPLMIQAEWRISRVLATPGKAGATAERNSVNKSASEEGTFFAFNFARDLLAEGAKSLALSRAVVLPLLSSLFFAGGLEAQKAAGGFFLPREYIRLLGDVLLHREFVLADGIECVPSDPFEEAETSFNSKMGGILKTAGACSAKETCSRCGQLRGISELDPAAFFLSKSPPCRSAHDLPCGIKNYTSSSSCFCPPLSMIPRVFARRFGRLQQTPAYVRLLTLALVDGVCTSLNATEEHKTSHEMFLTSAVSALFRDLAVRAIDSVTFPLQNAEEQDAALEEGANEYMGAEIHLPMPNSAKHRLQLRVWQSLSCLSVHANIFDPSACELLADSIWTVLINPLMPDVRHYVEFVAVRLTLRNPLQCVPRIKAMISNYNAPRQVLISGLCIAGYTLLNLRRFLSADEEVVQLETQLLCAVTPYLTSNAAYCRGIAQFLLHEFLSAEGSLHFGIEDNQSHRVGHSVSPIPQLYSMLEEAKECRMMTAKVAAAFKRWRPETDGGICGLIPESGIVEETIEQHDATLMGLTVVGIREREQDAERRFADVLSDFDLRPSWALALALKDVVKDEMKRAWHAEGPAEEGGAKAICVSEGRENQETEDAAISKAEDSAERCQRKFVPEQFDKESAGCCLLSMDDTACFNALRQRSDFIVIASLVTKAPNLGGLARTCEVFNSRQCAVERLQYSLACRALVVSNMDLLKDSSFRNISVSAHQWLPMVEVDPKHLPEYFETLRHEGYSIVGLEQTAFSRPLGEFSFPRKTALVLGAEKEGMPAPLMAYIDECVEIPQARAGLHSCHCSLGLIRSLNVHVSASLCIWDMVTRCCHLLDLLKRQDLALYRFIDLELLMDYTFMRDLSVPHQASAKMDILLYADVDDKGACLHILPLLAFTFDALISRSLASRRSVAALSAYEAPRRLEDSMRLALMKFRRLLRTFHFLRGRCKALLAALDLQYPEYWHSYDDHLVEKCAALLSDPTADEIYSV
ncbi:hypothetical protein Efla_001474 [Eimeria flavescens]